MGSIVQGGYALSPGGLADGWKPVIGWHNLVTPASLTATSALSGFPVTNLTTPRTNSLWKAAAATNPQYLTCLFGGAYDVDYAGLARHNLGGATPAPVTVQGLPAGGNPAVDGDWDEMVAEQSLADNGPAILRFTPTSLIGVRLRLEPSVAPQLAVLKIGKLIVLENGLPPGHVPITYGRKPEIASPRSQGGDHLGRTVLGGSLTSSIAQQDLDPDWYRDTLEPFVKACSTDTFFFAPFPEDYPREVGYCEVTNDPMPSAGELGRINIGFDIAGIAL